MYLFAANAGKLVEQSMGDWLCGQEWLAFRLPLLEFLDARYFGHKEDQDHQARLNLISENEKEAMEPFVTTQMEE